MKTFLARVVTTVVYLLFYLFVFRVSVGFPQVIDCRYTWSLPAVWMEIASARKHGELVTFRALGCTGYWHVNPRTS
jgi:hypothetical protein